MLYRGLILHVCTCLFTHMWQSELIPVCTLLSITAHIFHIALHT